jgi:hypothetical protein
VLLVLVIVLAAAVACAARAGENQGASLRTQDGFRLAFDPVRGDVVTTAPGGFSVRDFAAKSDFLSPVGSLEGQPDGSLRRVAAVDPLRLQLTTNYRVLGEAFRIDGEVLDLTGKDRAVTVRFAYPVDAVGWKWHDDQGSSRAIEAGKQYHQFVDSGGGATGTTSRWPFACISGPNEGLVLGAPLNLPRLWRFGYDAQKRELYAEVDLGLTAETRRFPSRADFGLVLYRSDPKWGFRSALERYYRLFPDCFTKRNAKEGIWMPFTDIATVEGWEDFGFQFKEGDNNVAWDAEHGIYSFYYVEPWSDWVHMPKDMPRTVAQATALVTQRASEGSEKDQAVLASAFESADGGWAGRIENQPWCDGAVFGVNPSPGVPTQPGRLTQFQNLTSQIDEAFKRSPRLTGVYHDSFEMYLFSKALNYRREHFRDAAIPLVFDPEGGVAQYAMFDMVEFAQAIAQRMWSRGGMTFANGTPQSFPWGAPWLDVMGTEAAWASSWGKFGEYVGEPASDFNYWRALCYHRPYLMLLNTRFDLWKPEWFEFYMKRCTAYGVFPSMFSHNASEDPYWRNPDLYNRHRPLFKKYLPIVSALNAAGWEPVTYARSDNPQVYVERFGKPTGPLYFTVYNDSDQVQKATIAFDLAQVKPGARELGFRDLITAGGPAAIVKQSAAALPVILQPRDLKVLRVE